MDRAERLAWQQADALFGELVELPAAQRQSRLEQLQPGSLLRICLERLLAADAAQTGPLERPVPMTLLPQLEGALTGRRLGRWRLLEEIGRGGMSVVYRAIADEGAAGQIAAVKVLTLGALAAQGRERFLHEQQALLRLRHPYLATLYDAGVAGDGTPWLAMTLVEGRRIDHWCGQHQLDVHARVRLVLQVCEALNYTHRNLIIHRDIKPSNVLVDDDGHVRLLDFGIARLLDDSTERTRTAMRALTPEYAAPEQFAGALPSTTMDVYGLGALLYRLLAERAPRTHAGHDGPPTQPPSNAVRGAMKLHVLERRRRTRHLRGDLDTVVMKALADRPEARYASVEALAEDLRRWLSQRPIRARAPSWRYRLGKFIARHRLGASASVMLVVLLAAGVGGTWWQARLARTEAQRAQAAVEESRAQLEYLDSVLEVMTPSTEAARDRDQRGLLREIAQRARRELADRPALLARVELSLGGVAGRIGDYEQAARLYAGAMGRRRALFGIDSVEFAEARLRWGAMLDLQDTADPPAAEAQLRAAVATLDRRRGDPRLLAEALVLWAGKLAEDDRHEAALTALRRAAGYCTSPSVAEAHVCEQALVIQSMVAHRTGQPQQAVAPLQTLLAMRERRYGGDDARTLFVLSGLGKTYAYTGQRERGLALLERAHAMQQRIYRAPTRETLHTMQALSTLLGEMGRYPRALELARRHLDQATVLFGEHHETLGVGYSDLGSLLFADGRYREAAEAYEHAHAIYAGLHGDDHAGATIALGNHADTLRELGRPREALPLQQRALARMEHVFGAGSPRVAARLTSLARIHVAIGEPAQALLHFDRSIAIYRAHAGAGDYRAAVVAAYRSQALLALGREHEAIKSTRTALDEITAALGRQHRYHWEALALHAHASCRTSGVECAAVRAQVREAAGREGLPGGPRLKLQQALASIDG